MYKNYIKRLVDIIISIIILIIIFPILFLILLCVYLITQNDGLFYLQERPGKNKKIFKVIKFKTMNDNRDKDGKLLSDGERLTKIGHFLRKYSLDEFPQLINVLLGDMSIVGPRPLLVEYLSKYNETQDKRHLVRPGITGLSQISGRQGILFSKRLELDVKYVENMTFLLDLKIMLKSIPVVLKSIGVKTGQDIKEIDDIGLSSKEQ